MNQEEISKLDLKNMANDELKKLTLDEINLLSYAQIDSLSLEKREDGFLIEQRNALLQRESQLLKEMAVSQNKNLSLNTAHLPNDNISSIPAMPEAISATDSNTLNVSLPSFREGSERIEESPFKLSTQFEQALDAFSTPQAEAYNQGINRLQQLAAEQLESRTRYYEHQQAIWNDAQEAERRIISDLSKPADDEALSEQNGTMNASTSLLQLFAAYDKAPSEQNDTINASTSLSQLFAADDEARSEQNTDIEGSQLKENIEKAEAALRQFSQTLGKINAEPFVVDEKGLRKGTFLSDDQQSTKIGTPTPSIYESIATDDDISVTESTFSRSTSESSSDETDITKSVLSFEEDYKNENSLATHHVAHEEELEERSPHQFVELVTGVRIAAGYAAQVLKSVSEGPEKGLEKKAELLQKDPMAWLGEVGKAQGIGEAVISAATMGIAAPLAIKTIMAGWEEYKHSKHTIKEIEEKIPEIEKTLQNLEQVSHLLPENAVRAAKIIGETQLKEMQFFLKQAKNNKKIGMAETIGGAAALAKTTLLATAKVGTHIASEVGASAATLGGLTTFATAVGIANTVIGPVAGGVAVYVGAKSYKSNKEKLNYLDEVRPETSAFLESAANEDPMLKHYQTAIETKLNHRQDFYKSNKRWNVNLMAGGTLFGATTGLGGATSIALASLGVAGLASNPVGAGILTATVSVGAVYMGTAVAHDYINASKQELYNKAMEGNAPGIDKDFLASLDSLALTAPGEIHPLMGVKTRATLSDSFAKCNHLVQDILHENGTGKPYKDLYIHSTDSEEVVNRRSTQIGKLSTGSNPNGNYWLRQRQTTMSGGSIRGRIEKPFTIAAHLLQGKGKEIATRAGNEVYAKRATYLTKTEYVKTLQDPANDNSLLFEKLGKILEKQAKGLAATIDSALKALPVSLNLFNKELKKTLEDTLKIPQTPEEMNSNIALADEIYKKAIATGDKRIEDSIMKYVGIMRLSQTFRAFSTGAVTPTDEQKAHAIEEYMARRKDEPHVPSKEPDVQKSFEELASFLMKKEPQIYRLQKATMPFVETYTSTMRTAMKKSLALDKTTKVAVQYEPESVDELIKKMKRSYESFTGKNMGNDQKKIVRTLTPAAEEFIKRNVEKSKRGEPSVSLDAFIRERFEGRGKKISSDEKDRSDKTSTEIKKPSKRGFSR